MTHRWIALALAACLTLAGCSVFAPKSSKNNAHDLLTKPITAPKRAEAKKEAEKPGFLKRMVTPKEEPPPKDMDAYMGLKPIRP
jgi:hypothetical protein